MPVYVFGYASLVDRDSLQATLGRTVDPSDGPHPVRLHGFRRSWNVAAHSSIRPDYRFCEGDGSPWEGWIVFLGLQPSPGDLAPGAVYRLEQADLDLLDLRERSYDRVDVTDRVEPPVGGGRVHTYLPKPEARARARNVAAAGTVMARYLRLVERGFRTLGAEPYDEHRRTLPAPDPFSVKEITASPRDTAARNQAVDPATDPRS